MSTPTPEQARRRLTRAALFLAAALLLFLLGLYVRSWSAPPEEPVHVEGLP